MDNPLPIFLLFAITFPLNNKPRTTIPKIFFMNPDPTNIQIGCLGDGIILYQHSVLKIYQVSNFINFSTLLEEVVHGVLKHAAILNVIVELL